MKYLFREKLLKHLKRFDYFDCDFCKNNSEEKKIYKRIVRREMKQDLNKEIIGENNG